MDPSRSNPKIASTVRMPSSPTTRELVHWNSLPCVLLIGLFLFYFIFSSLLVSCLTAFVGADEMINLFPCIFLFFKLIYCSYETTIVEGNVVKPISTKMQFKTEAKVPKVRQTTKTNFNVSVQFSRKILFAYWCSLSFVYYIHLKIDWCYACRTWRKQWKVREIY